MGIVNKIMPVAQAAQNVAKNIFSTAPTPAPVVQKTLPTPAPVVQKTLPTPAPAAQKPTGMMLPPEMMNRIMQGFQGKKFKEGGKASSSKSSGKVPSASKRGDGIAQRGKTKGRML
jgi:hypothetical protein